MYGISDKYDGHSHESDKGRSRTWPSRTSWGAFWSLSEKYPFLFETRWFTKAWGYWDGYTCAQIELGIFDQPVTDYHSQDKDGKNGSEPGKKEMDALALAWEKQRGGKTYVGGSFSIEDIFNA